MAAKKSSGNSGSKKVFSVPVGKLRIKHATPGRSGSNSGSGSVSVHRHKLLLKNNRELARSLSLLKERYRMMMSENLDLKTMIHECRLEVLGLEKKLRETTKSNSAYRESLMVHIWNAVRCSVSLTESLNQAVSASDGISVSEDPHPKESCVSRDSSTSSGGVPPLTTCSLVPVAQPQKQRVNPMISGHTIRYPTISLKRVVMDDENKAVDKRNTSAEEEDEENVEDVSQSMESSHTSRVGLSTCVEEDEEGADSSADEGGAKKMESDEEDSIRRKIVSFRCSMKDKSSSDCEVEETSGSNDSSRNPTREINRAEKRASRESGTPKVSLPITSMKGPVPGSLRRRFPLVALNDVGKLLQNSRSINVMKIPFANHSQKSIEMEIEVPNHPSENGNVPKQSLTNKTDARSCGENGSSQLPVENGKEKGDTEDSNVVGRGKSSEGILKPETKNKTSNCAMDDPLEGTSWMYLDNFSGNKNKRKHKAPQMAPKHKKVSLEDTTTTKNDADKNIVQQKTIYQMDRCASDGGTVNPVVEETPNFQCVLGDQQTKVNGSNTRKTSHCDDDLDYDAGDISIALRNNLMAQSTPVHKGKQTQISCELPSTTVISESPSKSPSDYVLSSSVSSLKDGSSQLVDEDKEKDLCSPVYDSKITRNAFVTVRVRRLVLPDVSPVNNLTGTCTEVDSNFSRPLLCHQESDDNLGFLGFDGECVADECSNVQAFKRTISSVTDEYLVSGIDLRSSASSSAYTFGISCESIPVENGSCDGCDDTRNNGGRPRRKAAPKELKEPLLNKKLRRDTIGPKKKQKNRKVQKSN